MHMRSTTPRKRSFGELRKKGVAAVCFPSLAAAVRDGLCVPPFPPSDAAREAPETGRKEAINLSDGARISPLWSQSTPGTNSEEC